MDVNILSQLKNEQNDTDEIEDGMYPYYQRRKSSIDEFELFTSILPKKQLEFELNEHYDELIEDLFNWDKFFEIFKYRIFTFQEFINNKEFLNIVNTHKKMVESGSVDGILPLLNCLMKRKINFLIPFVYITNNVPAEYKKTNMIFFGKTDNYPELISKVKEEIEASPSTMGVCSIKEILKDCDNEF